MSAVVKVVKKVVEPVLDIGSDIANTVMKPVFEVMDFVRDEIAAPVFDVAIDNIDIYDAIQIGLVLSGVPPWVVGVSSGAATIARGGDLSDAIKAGAISYAGATVGKTFDTKIAPRLTDTLTAEGFNKTVSSMINEGVKSSAKALVYGQNPLEAFAVGGLNAGVGATLGAIDDAYTNLTGEYELTDLGEFKLDTDGLKIPVVAGWENLQDGVKDAIAAGVTAEFNGGDVSSAVLTNIVSKYSGLAKTMNNFMTSEEGLGLDDDKARVLTTALGNAAGAAIDGNTELTFDAFFKTIEDYGYKELKEAIDKPVYEGLDKITGDYEKTSVAADALNTTIATAQNATEEYNSLRTALESEVNVVTALGEEAKRRIAAFNNGPRTSQSDANEVTRIKNEYDSARAALETKYSNYYTPTLATLKGEHDTAMLAVNDAQIEYDDQSQYLMSDINDLDISLSPIFNEVQREIVLALKPDANLEVIANYLGVDEVDAASAFLSTNGSLTNMPNTQSEADAALDQTRLQYVTAALNARGIPVESLSPNQLGKYLNYAKEFLGNTNDILNLDMNEFADSMIYSAELSPEIIKAAKDAGFVPEAVDNYDMFLTGEYIRVERTGDAGDAPEFLDTRGLTDENVDQWLSTYGYTQDDVTHVGDGYYNRDVENSTTYGFEKPPLEELNSAVGNFLYLEDPMQTTGTRVLDEVVLGEGVGAQQLLDGSAILTNNDGVPTWELRTTQDTATGGVDTTAVLEQAFTGTSKEDMINSEGYEVFIGGGAIFNPEDNAYARSKLQIATLATMNPNEGQTYDEFTNSSLYKTTATLYDVFRETFSDEENKDALDNTVSVITGAGGELLQAISGLTTLVGNNPNNALGQTAKNMLRLSGDMRSDEWTAAAQEMATNSANYDTQWREDNPGKEPTTLEKASLKAQAIWGNFTDHPAQFLAENVASEVLQELPILLASGGVGNVAKALLVKAGKENANRLATKAALSTALTLDTAEAFGGTAASTFDEVYATALKMGKSEQEATDIALDTAQKAGTIASLATIFTGATMGGQALAKSILGDNASSLGKGAFEALYDVVLEGTRVTIKEGITESIEEGLPQLYTATVQKQLDPSFDVAGSVTEASIMGTIAGAGTASTLYTGNVVADTLSMVNSDVQNVFANTSTAEAATTALQELGLTDNVVLNNVLNSTYDTMYVSTNEADTAFSTANPDYKPTQADIDSIVTSNPSADLDTAVTEFINPKFLSADEVKAAALEEGIILTDEQAEAYVGQKDEASATTDIRNEYDPLATTKDEATQYFADTGYTATPEELADFIGTLNEEVQKTAIGDYVNPRQVTKDEAKQFLEDVGYNADEDEIARFIGQTNDDTFQDTQRTAINEYTDPRVVTGDEVRSRFQELGFNDPTETDVGKFTGQFDQTAKLGEIEEYLPTAQYNSIAELLGKPARNVTQEDVDFVANKIALDEVLTERQTLDYDVTGDGVVDQFDNNLLMRTLSGDTDTALADTAMFDSATGMYAQLDTQNDTQAQLDAVIDLNTQLNTQVNTLGKKTNFNQFQDMLMGANDLSGQQVAVKSGDKVNLDYLYDFESVFANPQQEALFGSPYGAAPTANPRGGSFAQGGQIEDKNDMLLRILGEV